MNKGSKFDVKSMNKTIKLALRAEENGNLPIGALIVMEGDIIAKGSNTVKYPKYHPGRHAEIEALKKVPLSLWSQSSKMTCYTTLEPCIMCFGSLVLHGVGRIVFGANDPRGGAGVLLDKLPEYYKGGSNVPEWTGPIMPEKCNPLYQRAAKGFERLSDNLC